MLFNNKLPDRLSYQLKGKYSYQNYLEQKDKMLSNVVPATDITLVNQVYDTVEEALDRLLEDFSKH